MKNKFTKVLNKKITLDSGNDIYLEIGMNTAVNPDGTIDISDPMVILTIPDENGTTTIHRIPFSLPMSTEKENAAD